MLRHVMDMVDPALATNTPVDATRAFYDALVPLGATYCQTRHYRRPDTALTSKSHFAAGGVIARIARDGWAGSPAFNYICFDQNPILGAIREGRTQYRFCDFAPHEDKRFGTYWEAMSEAGIRDAICATSYGAGRAIASLHLGFDRRAFAPEESRAISLAGLILTEHLMRVSLPLAPDSIDLTRRERDCLAFVSEGKGDLDIATIMNISPATVRFHVDNARTKLGANNRPQAVARLAHLRMI
jgi:LuxR family transcriptional regulator, quorum-sensing system regulator BjaR1